MKTILPVLMFICSGAYAQLSESDLIGTYEITSDFQPGIINVVTLAADGREIFIEKSPKTGRDLNCQGTYFVDDSENLTSTMTCENGKKFTQIISLVNISATQLAAGVKTTAASSLFGLNHPFPVFIKKSL